MVKQIHSSNNTRSSHQEMSSLHSTKRIASIIERRLFQNREDPLPVATRLKHGLTFQQLEDIIARLRNPHTLARLFNRPIVKDYADLHHRAPNSEPTSDWLKEAAWHCLASTTYSTQIAHFLKKRVELSNFLLLGDYHKASQALDSIEQECGPSLYTLQRRFLLAHLDGGITANRSLLNSLQSSAANPVLLGISKFVSVRAEFENPAVYYEAYVRRGLGEIAQTWGLQLREYIAQYAHPLLLTPPPNPSFVLWFSNGSTIVDRYLLTIRAFRSKLASYSTVEERSQIRTLIASLSLKIQDPDLENLLALLTGAPPKSLATEAQKVYIRALDAYVAGDYISAATQGMHLLRLMPTCFHLYELVAKSCLYSGTRTPELGTTDSMANQTLGELNQFYSGRGILMGQNQLLRKIGSVLGETHLGYNLFLLSTNSQKIPQLNQTSLLSELHSTLLNPKMALGLEPHDRDTVLDWFQLAYPDSASSQFYRLKHSRKLKQNKQLKGLDYFRWRLHLAEELIAEDKCKAAQRILEKVIELLPHNDVRWHRHVLNAYSLLYDCALAMQRTLDALQAIVSAFFFHEESVTRFDLASMNLQTRTFSSEDAKHICVPIARFLALDRFSLKKGSPSDLARQSHAVYLIVDDFLAAHKCERPSDLIEVILSAPEYFEPPQSLNYFLDELCCLVVLSKAHRYASTTDELESERIKLCSFLLKVSSRNAESLKSELSAISKRRLARTVRAQVDMSRIAVNDEVLRAASLAVHASTFARFLRFSKLAASDAIEVALPSELGLNPTATKPSSPQDDFSKRPSDLCLLDIVGSLVIAFTLDENYGLNSALSRSIRHGSFLGALRKPFEQERLVTRRPLKGAPYAANEFWIAQAFSSDASTEEIAELFSHFTSRLDDLVTRTCDNLLQVRIPLKATSLFSHEDSAILNPDGLFCYVGLDREIILEARDSETPISALEDIVDLTLVKLWERTDENLRRVRAYLDSSFKQAIMRSLDELLTRAQELLPTEAFAGLHRAVTRTRTQVQHEIAGICQWFTRKLAPQYVDVPLDSVLTATIDTINECSGNFLQSIQVESKVEAKVRGKFVTHMYDLLFILLSNIVEHSASSWGTAEASVSMSFNEDHCTIIVENNCYGSNSITDVVKHANELIASSALSLRDARQGQEGNTGLAKVVKILRIDLKQPLPTILARRVGENRFRISVEIDSHEVFAA